MNVVSTAENWAGQTHQLLEGYGCGAGAAYDEAIGSDGRVRPHWMAFFAGLEGLNPTERAGRAALLDRRVRQTGIAYDIFADPNDPSQRWQLDLVPVIISAAEWRGLEAALMQRARLFDRLLADLYGGQSTLRDGLVPAELVFSDSAFLMPCRSVLPRAGGLQFYAADLARGADGRWRVIDNHTETNAGLGYALANRVAHTHVTGDLFKAANCTRLAGYFQELQASLAAHSGREDARIALLTPGPHHDDYFSHAYLARYLGYQLVEGSDLRTRGNGVYLKTLEGLKEIDLIVRCVDGSMIDPLELDPGGFDGPAGLVRVTRHLPHLVVNAAGTALAQNRGLGALLPKLSQSLLGEELLLSDARRVWLGDAAARKHVLANLDGYVIRMAQEGLGRPGRAALGYDPAVLTGQQLDVLRGDIELHGARLVAEEKVGFSTAPVVSGEGLAAQPFAMRLYVSNSADGYQVMPGGLAMTLDPERAVALSAPEGQTRDIWIQADGEQEPHVSLWRPTFEAARVQRSQRVLQSRVADDLFWLGRYCERADWTMRILRGALRRIEEDGGTDLGRRAARCSLNTLLTNSGNGDVNSIAEPGDAELEALCDSLIAGSGGARTLQRTVQGLYRTAHLVRDRLSLEAWQALSRFRPGDIWARALTSSSPLGKLDPLDEGLAGIAAFNGLMHENMTRNFGWSFLVMGRRLERAYNLAEAIYALFIPKVDAEEETSRLLLLLELADSFITYRSRYRLDPMLPLVLDLLLLDETNPRSHAYQLADISRHMESLPDPRQGSGLPEHRRLVITALSAIRLADVEGLAAEASRSGLEELIGTQLQQLPEISNALALHYFNLMHDTPHRLLTRSDRV